MKGTAVALILMLPAVMLADINRLSPSPDLESDVYAWNPRPLEQAMTVSPTIAPSWEAAFTTTAGGCIDRPVACPGLTPAPLTPCISQPDCRSTSNGPDAWLFALAAAEENTVTAEPRPEAETEPNQAPPRSRENLQAK